MAEPAPASPAPPRAPTRSGPSGPRASFGRRVVAALVDGLVVSVVYWIVWAVATETLASAANLVVGIAYFTYFEGSASGQTAGKRLLGIRVIDFSTGGPIGYGRALVRYVARFLSAIPCLLGYFWMLWDGEKQTWHDKLASDVVVPTDAYPVDRWPG